MDNHLDMIHDVNPSQLGEAQYSSAFCRSSEVLVARSIKLYLLAAWRGPVVHRATSTTLQYAVDVFFLKIVRMSFLKSMIMSRANLIQNISKR